jgi:hypothetical protein
MQTQPKNKHFSATHAETGLLLPAPIAPPVPVVPRSHTASHHSARRRSRSSRCAASDAWVTPRSARALSATMSRRECASATWPVAECRLWIQVMKCGFKGRWVSNKHIFVEKC